MALPVESGRSNRCSYAADTTEAECDSTREVAASSDKDGRSGDLFSQQPHEGRACGSVAHAESDIAQADHSRRIARVPLLICGTVAPLRAAGGAEDTRAPKSDSRRRLHRSHRWTTRSDRAPIRHARIPRSRSLLRSAEISFESEGAGGSPLLAIHRSPSGTLGRVHAETPGDQVQREFLGS